VSLKIEGENVAPAVAAAIETIGGTGGEIELDFSSVRRIDARALAALEKLAGAVDGKSVQVKLCGVNVDVYKALKLAKLAPRFSFPA
jgi:anti-anti-sigma regulatory factor